MRFSPDINTAANNTIATELEPLKFPSFRRELLYQNHWNPGDDTGRIKILISEGFPRDSLTTPIERVKNVVAFAFQHTPIGWHSKPFILLRSSPLTTVSDILERNGIAWPNPHMWRPPIGHPASITGYHLEELSDSHGHSPRRSAVGIMGNGQGVQLPLMHNLVNSQPSGMMNPVHGETQRTANGLNFPDTCEPGAYRDWLNSMGLGQFQMPSAQNCLWSVPGRTMNKHSSTDTSMPDYGSSYSIHSGPDQMHISGPSLEDDYGLDAPKVPTNTPTAATPGNLIQSSG